jgi:hypothetical protein
MGGDKMASDLSPSPEKKNVQKEGIEGMCVLCYLEYISRQMKWNAKARLLLECPSQNAN